MRTIVGFLCTLVLLDLGCSEPTAAVAPPPSEDGGADVGDAAPQLDAGDGSDAAEPNPLGRMASARALAFAVSSSDGKISVVGGLASVGVLSSLEVYDPATNEWKTKKAAAGKRYGHAAVADANGHIYVFGGTADGSTMLASAEMYTIASDTWTALPDMPTARVGLGAAIAPDGRIFVFGGRAAAPIESVEIFSPTTNTWATGTTMPSQRIAMVAVVGNDGKILAIGGRNGADVPLASVDILDPAANGGAGAWSAGPPMKDARYWFGATRAADGRIHAIGGVGSFGFIDSHEVLGPSGWSNAAKLPQALGWVNAAPSSDGRVFAVGGALEGDNPEDRATPVATILAYDPAADRWLR